MPVQRTSTSPRRSKQLGNESIVNSRFLAQIVAAPKKCPLPASLSAPVSAAFSYPETVEARAKYRNMAGKRLSAHQWAVYDFTRTIPKGKVATYKDVASAVGGSPRSVGGALRNNPFSPHVPCHRIIASSLFVGGFFGEWGEGHKTGRRYNDKLAMLSQEGVPFDERGHLLTSDKVLWKP